MSRRTGNETLEERLLGEVGVVLLEVLLGGGDELDGDELEAGERRRSGVSGWVLLMRRGRLGRMRTRASRSGR
jgi:hypothetical protein